MYILSFYEGFSELSFALGSRLFKFPYTYVHNLFSNSFTKEQFYTDVFNLAAKELQLNLKECEIYACGLLDIPKLPFECAKTFVLVNNLSDNHIFLSQQMVALKNEIHSYTSLDLYETENNFLANIDIYPSLKYTDTKDINVKDTLLRAILSDIKLSIKEGTVILTGERFADFANNEALSYLLVLDTIREVGAYRIKVDRENSFPHYLMLDMLENSDEEYFSLGTLVNTPGKTECLYKTDLGTSQMIELEDDKIFILPLDKAGEATVFIKNSKNSFEKKVHGGVLGVIIDTRDKEVLTSGKVGLDAIIQALNKI